MSLQTGDVVDRQKHEDMNIYMSYVGEENMKELNYDRLKYLVEEFKIYLVMIKGFALITNNRVSFLEECFTLRES